MRTAFLLAAVVLSCPGAASSHLLFSNAARVGLLEEGLKTKQRPTGGWYSELQFPNGAAAASFRNPTFRLGDDFTVPGPGWRVKSISVYGFQPTVHSPSIGTGSIEIRIGSVVGPVVAQGSVQGSTMTDIYRIFFNQPHDDYQIQRVTYRINSVVPAGYYWITFSAFGISNLDGPWGPFLTKVGEVTVPGANAMGRVSGPYIGWEPIIDGGSNTAQDLPFEIEGHKLQSIGPTMIP